MNRASQSPESPIAGPTPSRPIMAPVIEFSCLFSHDLKRKQKRWKDGRLKFHTFNKRVMVYDDRGNSVGDMHWQEHLIFQEGEEIYLDRGGVVVQVCECKGYKEQDLTELLTRRHRATAPPPESTAATPLQNRGSRRAPATSFNPPRSVPPALHDTPESSQIIHGASRPSCFQTPSRGPIGRAIIPRSPFEERRAQLVASSQPLAAAAVAPTDAPPAKRQRQNGGAQKSTYATSLFGAALNLSTAPSRSTPVRQAIPRLHSINPDAQLSSSVTSLRTSYRDTRSRNSPSESPRTPALGTNLPLSQTSTSLSSGTIYIDDNSNDSRDGENILERSSAPITARECPRSQNQAPNRLTSKTPSIEVLEDQLQKISGEKSQKTYQINATTATQKRTRDASPKIRTPQLNKTAKETFASSPELSRDQTFKKHGTSEPKMGNATQQLSQPRVELQLQPRKKRKRLMISAPLPMAMSPLQSPASMILPANEELLVCEQEDMGAQVQCKGKGRDFVQKKDGLAIRRDTTPLMCPGTLDLVPTRDDDICIAHSILSNQAQSNISQSPPKSPPQAREILRQPSPLSSPSSTPFMNTPYKTCLHPLTNAIVLPPHNTSSTSSESTTAPLIASFTFITANSALT
ncbi:hypothetical protein HOO65_100108 [Ceratocystis lukuohia]|uniref:5'-3' DNA helicase ZGRF1-like N-terminal domain-containing protein n=1 Tax=Ceratocystis lukuohia TaxID=2019550 RepID=A0ABR4M8Y1_9PEZI